MKSFASRIGIFEPSPGPSGPSRYVESILGGIDTDEFEVLLFCRAEGPYRPRPGVQLVHLPPAQHPPATPSVLPAPAGQQVRLPQVQRSRRALGLLGPRLWLGFGRESLALARCFRPHPVDLFHTNNTGCEESAVAARLAGITRIVGTFHVDSTYDLERVRGTFRHRVLECLSNHCLDLGIGVSRATSRDWARRTHLPAARVVTIHNGVDPCAFQRRCPQATARRQLGLPEEALILGGVGRLDPAKGFADLLEAVSLLAGQYPRLHLALAGQGPSRAALVEQASRLQVAERVHFLGFCRGVQQVYDALDVFVLSSLCEALPYAVLEAMATGLPVVGTRVGGMAEMIVPGETGFLVPARSPSELAAAIRSLLESADLRQRLGQRGRERVVRHFQEKDMVARTIQVYRDLLNLGRRRREREKVPGTFFGGGERKGNRRSPAESTHCR